VYRSESQNLWRVYCLNYKTLSTTVVIKLIVHANIQRIQYTNKRVHIQVYKCTKNIRSPYIATTHRCRSLSLRSDEAISFPSSKQEIGETY